MLVGAGEDQSSFEVATFRKDLGYSDSRRPDAIEYTDEREDAVRRDFTINGVFLDPETGQVLDYVGGKADLERGVIRAIGDPFERIREDRLRMLRAVRFAARMQFSIERATFEAVRASAASIVDTVSAERIRDELVKMLTAGDPSPLHSCIQRAACRQPDRRTHSPMGLMSPVSSAIERNSPGGRRPRSGCCQRTRASQATILPDSVSTMG